MRRLWLVLGVALVVAAPGAAASQTADRGLILRVRPPHFVLHELDGSRVRFTIRKSTVVTLDGHRVRLAQLRRGDVAVVLRTGPAVAAVNGFRP